MKNLLFLGGTAFFGRQAVRNLLGLNKYKITIATRGNNIVDEFNKSIEHIYFDRTNSQQMREKLKDRHFDIIVDNSAKTSTDISNILDIYHGSINHYLFCSSGAVYPKYGHHEWLEDEATLEILPELPVYANDKREAEKTLKSYTDTPYTIYRPTVVQGPLDPTGRTSYFVDKIIRQEFFYIPAGVILKHVYVDDLACAIVKLIEFEPHNEAYNICGDELVTLDEYCFMLAKTLNKKPCYKCIEPNEFNKIINNSLPTAYSRTLLLNNIKIKETIDFQPASIHNWLPVTIKWCLEYLNIKPLI